MNVVVVGAGVIGSAISYYLKGIGAWDVEACEVACAASGKSGGFLARNWCGGSARTLARGQASIYTATCRST